MLIQLFLVQTSSANTWSTYLHPKTDQQIEKYHIPPYFSHIHFTTIPIWRFPKSWGYPQSSSILRGVSMKSSSDQGVPPLMEAPRCSAWCVAALPTLRTVAEVGRAVKEEAGRSREASRNTVFSNVLWPRTVDK